MTYILIGLVSYWFAEWSHVPQGVSIWLRDKRIYFKQEKDGNTYRARLKPFDCTLCLSFWWALGHSIYLGNGIHSFLYAGVTSLGAVLFSLTVNRYLR